MDEITRIKKTTIGKKVKNITCDYYEGIYSLRITSMKIDFEDGSSISINTNCGSELIIE